MTKRIVTRFKNLSLLQNSQCFDFNRNASAISTKVTITIFYDTPFQKKLEEIENGEKCKVSRMKIMTTFDVF